MSAVAKPAQPAFRLERQMRPIVRQWLLLDRGLPYVRAEYRVPWGAIDLVGFSAEPPRRRRGERGLAAADQFLVAVELKLARFADVLAQADNNRSLSDESWVALPLEAAWRFSSGPAGCHLIDLGLGLLGVHPAGVDVLHPPRAGRRRWCPKSVVVRGGRGGSL